MQLFFSTILPTVFLFIFGLPINVPSLVSDVVRIDIPVVEKVQAAKDGGSVIFDAPVSIQGPAGAFSATKFSDADNPAYFIEPASTGDALVVNGNIGIGTTNPSSKLEVIGSMKLVDGTQSSGYVLTSDANGGASWAVSPSNYWTKVGSTIMPLTATDSIATTGTIGIGSTNPTYKLHINNATTDTDTAVTYMGLFNNRNVRIEIGSYNATGSEDYIYYNAIGNFGHRFRVDGTDLMTIDNNGEVGIGTAAPAAKLTVNGNTLVGYGSGVYGPANGLAVSGNVGVGTTSPSEKLHVVGNGKFSGSVRADTSVTDAIIGVSEETAGVYGSSTNGWDFYGAGPKSYFSGNVGIGTTAPDTKLHVVGVSHLGAASGSVSAPTRANSNILFHNTGDTNFSGIGEDVSGGVYFVTGALGVTSSARVFITASGLVGIGTTAPGSKLHILGGTNDVLLVEDDSGACEAQPTTTGLTWSCSSDARLKTNIVDASPQLPYILNIPLKNYTVKKTGERTMGPIAQEIQQNYPELVSTGDDGYLQVSELSPWKMVKGMQELNQRIEDLTEQIEELKK